MFTLQTEKSISHWEQRLRYTSVVISLEGIICFFPITIWLQKWAAYQREASHFGLSCFPPLFFRTTKRHSLYPNELSTIWQFCGISLSLHISAFITFCNFQSFKKVTVNCGLVLWIPSDSSIQIILVSNSSHTLDRKAVLLITGKVLSTVV